jgi:hypothetical protein
MRRQLDSREEVLAAPGELELSVESQISQVFLNYSMKALRRGPGTYELEDICSPTRSIKKSTDWVTDFGIGSDFVCLNSGAGEGFILYSRSTGAIFDVGVAQIAQLNAGTVQPRWPDFHALME